MTLLEIAPPSSRVLDLAIAQFASAVRVHYGPRLKGIYLYGSRARGDARPDSDVDIAVVLDRVDGLWAEVHDLCKLSYEFLSDGVYIEARPIAEEIWRDPGLHRNPSLVRAMKRDALILGAF